MTVGEPSTPLEKQKIMTPSGEQLLSLVPVQIQGKTYIALLDTGAPSTLISEELVKLTKLQIGESGELGASSLTGHSINIIGTTDLEMKIASQKVKAKVLVSNKSPYKLIIGTDILKQLGSFTLNFEKGTLRKEAATSPLGTVHVDQILDAVTKETFEIPAQSAVVAQATFKGSLFQRSCFFLPSDGWQEKSGLILAAAAVSPNENSYPVRIFNPSKASVQVHKGTSIGSLEPLLPAEEAFIDEQWKNTSNKTRKKVPKIGSTAKVDETFLKDLDLSDSDLSETGRKRLNATICEVSSCIRQELSRNRTHRCCQASHRHRRCGADQATTISNSLPVEKCYRNGSRKNVQGKCHQTIIQSLGSTSGHSAEERRHVSILH